jgi:hypothetical protein
VTACTEETAPPGGLNVGGVLLSRCTDGATVETGFANGSPVNKIWVNAFITITPSTDVNPVDTNHVLTCTIQVNLGAGAGFVNAPNGTVCDGDISGVGSFVGGDSCTVDGDDGNCTITITSAVSGTSTVTACTEETAPPGGLNVGGVLLSRCTDGATVETGFANSGPATKIWVDTSISTQSSQTGTVTAPATITDTATVTKDAPAAAPDPTGTVTFYICGPLASATGCAAGTQVGAPVALSATAPFQATSSGYSVTSSTAPGHYCWRAVYSGDVNYPSVESTSPENECFFVRQPTTLDTLASNTGTVTAGASITDTATLSIAPLDLATAPAPTGSVTFTLCGPNAAVSTSLNCTAFGSVALSCPASGSTCTATSAAFSVTTSTIPGFYCFKASWPGDTNYTGSSHTDTASECFFVRQPTTLTTQASNNGTVTAGASITDTATLSIAPLDLATAPAPTGSVTFNLC